MSETKEDLSQKVEEPKKAKSSKWWLACLLIPVIMILIIALLYFLYWISNRDSKSSPTSTTSQTVNKGQWTLDLTYTSTMTGIQTSLDGTGSGKISFEMPGSGSKFTSSGEWNSEAGGTVGSSQSTATIKGKVNVSGEITNNKLHLDVSYLAEECVTTLNTPLGSSTSTTCEPGNQPDPHVIDIDMTDGATTTSDFNKDYGNYKLTWRENWALSKVK